MFWSGRRASCGGSTDKPGEAVTLLNPQALAECPAARLPALQIQPGETRVVSVLV